MFDYQPASNLLDNKTILITGAGDGIGRAAAVSFAGHGASVILAGRTVSRLEEVYDEIEALNPGRAIIHPLDLLTAGEEDFKVLANSIDEQFACLDGVLHNAAQLGPRSPIEHYPYAQWQELMQVNVNAAFLLTRALLAALNRSQSGRLLFTASSVGRQGRAYWGAYSVSKFAVEGLMQVLADELANTSAIRVNSINPGGTRTRMRAAAYPAENPATVPTPESLMPVYLYLMGPQGEALHGQALDARSFDPLKF
ncbi:MAG: YciK family oxidoreductase [Gammaproteobacteria bacterium]|nr:YciK family oxidoreductase [Pseudomonadales bacterium]MCP5345871.1 YciK family oxidoreductase [Pseudomonadales bacterium]